jgi:hypothetical protein
MLPEPAGRMPALRGGAKHRTFNTERNDWAAEIKSKIRIMIKREGVTLQLPLQARFRILRAL